MSKENTYPAKRNTTLIQNRKKAPTHSFSLWCSCKSCNPKTILRILTVHTLLQIPPPPTHPLKTTKSHKKYNTPNPECMQNCNHRKLQNNNNNNKNNRRRTEWNNQNMKTWLSLFF
jgi:hypothetical protein